MSKDDAVYLGHMMEMARKVADKLDGVERSNYDDDENLRLALTHLLQVIGEAASRVSREFRDASPQIEWPAIIGMRQKVVHDYMNVDEDIVWETATRDIPPLISALEPLLGR
jgi:uncharacterized protein with HEPN domain